MPESLKQSNLVVLLLIVVVAVVLLLIVVVMMMIVPRYYRTTLKLYRGRYTFSTVRIVDRRRYSRILPVLVGAFGLGCAP